MKYLSLIALISLLAACGSGPGVAPTPPTNNDTYNGDLPAGTANDIYSPGR